jgi:uncharacterized protein YjgD (DUF1641 family)
LYTTSNIITEILKHISPLKHNDCSGISSDEVTKFAKEIATILPEVKHEIQEVVDHAIDLEKDGNIIKNLLNGISDRKTEINAKFDGKIVSTLLTQEQNNPRIILNALVYITHQIITSTIVKTTQAIEIGATVIEQHIEPIIIANGG